jgi:hypothetical protein
MSKRYSTPTVSFADRQDARPLHRDSGDWPPRISAALSRSKEVSRRYNGRGFDTSDAVIKLMNSWLRGKL